ncbi:MAG: prepilin-type N-terminal cleavage/methylation domain-containing protein [Gallionella sp.]|nr:MAG: prepilin-type N-terminal cleavage/methylation domain-containing protein [Gallionella sp.]
MKRDQSGFTLIEIAIVLVIIGLLLGGVLKGQELINSAKVKNLASDFKNIPVFVYGYQDKFKALPGDDKAAVNHVAATTNGDGNGVINGNWNDPAATLSEAVNFWQHVRLAGLAPGPTATTDATYMPTNTVGGTIGIQSGTTDTTKTPIKDLSAPAVAIRGSYIICSSGILGKFVKQLDTTMDDGNTATGSMMAGVATAAGIPMTASPLTGAGAIDDALAYTVCMGI